MIREVLGISGPVKFNGKPFVYIYFPHYMRTLKQINQFEISPDKDTVMKAEFLFSTAETTVTEKHW